MKKIWCLLLIFAVLLSALIACDVTQNDINNTDENTVESSEGRVENDSTNDTKKQPSAELSPSFENISTYDDIITMYKQIVNLYPSYTEEKLLSNQVNKNFFLSYALSSEELDSVNLICSFCV